MKETMCDTCMSPGHCCKRLALSGSSEDPTRRPQEPQSLEAIEHFLLRSGHSMFRPLEQDETGKWRFWCTALLPNGRCGIYETRPHVCRVYKPGEDPLCVHYHSTE